MKTDGVLSEVRTRFLSMSYVVNYWEKIPNLCRCVTAVASRF